MDICVYITYTCQITCHAKHAIARGTWGHACRKISDWFWRDFNKNFMVIATLIQNTLIQQISCNNDKLALSTV